MTPEQQQIIDEMKAHVAVMSDLVKKLEDPAKVKKGIGLTPEQIARHDARLIKKMYR